METTNDILIGLSLIRRIPPLIEANSGRLLTVSKLKRIHSYIGSVFEKLQNYCNDALVINPLLEVSCLIEDIIHTSSSEDVPYEMKKTIAEKVNDSIINLYLFTGKFYMTHEFTYTVTNSQLITEIIDVCISNGFYFGYDEILRQEGEL